MAVLNIKNLPDALYKKLQARAKRERHSVAQEVTYLLSEAQARQGALAESRCRMGLIRDLGRGPVGVDTAIFIYFIKEHKPLLSEEPRSTLPACVRCCVRPRGALEFGERIHCLR